MNNPTNPPLSTFKLFGMTFDVGNMIAATVAAVIVFLLIFALSRNLKVRPTGKKQAVLEWLANFTNGIVRGTMGKDDASSFSLYAFTLFIFLFIANLLGLFVQLVGSNGVTYIKSPTANPIFTLTLAMITMTMAHISGIFKLGFKKYFVNAYLKPFTLFLPINIFEEFANFVTLGLRLFGNIFAGEMLLKLIGNAAFSHGVFAIVGFAPLELIWQGFSIFIGSIQAFVFVTLTSVYISSKISAN